MKSRIVVLGASGFIGRRVVQLLSAEDWAHPVAVSRHARASWGPEIEALDADLSEGAPLRAAIAGAAGIVNCIAGSPRLLRSVADTLFDSAARPPDSQRIVHLSSLAAYGSATGEIDESSHLRGDLDAYSAAKADTDRLAAASPRTVILRPGIVYGPGSSWWSDRIARLLVRGRLGDLGNAGRGYCNLVYVDDVATAVVRALRLSEDQGGAFNLSLHQPITWNDYFSRYAAALGLPGLSRMSRSRLIVETRMLAPPLKIFERLLGRPSLARWNPLPPLRPWLPHMAAHDIRMDVRRAEQVLLMQWTPLEAGLRATAHWFLGGGRTAA